MAVYKTTNLLRISYLTRTYARSLVQRIHANLAASPVLQHDSEEAREYRELAKRCVSASAVGKRTPRNVEATQPPRCPVMKLSSVKRQVRTYATTMNPHPGYQDAISYSDSASGYDENVIEVAIPRKEIKEEFEPYRKKKIIPSYPGYGFTALPFPLPVLPNVAEQIEKMQEHEAEIEAAKEAQVAQRRAEIEEEERLVMRLAREARSSAQRSLERTYQDSVERFMDQKGRRF